MLKVGLTGNIGSGKSTLVKVFESLGVSVYKSDIRAKVLMNNSVKIKIELIHEFGSKSYQNNELNTSYISAIVFNDPNKLDLLNSIVHPYVLEDFNNWSEKQNSPYVIKEAAIMFESGSASLLDKVICVTASKDLRLKRVVKRDNTREENIEKRMLMQWPEKKKVQASDFIIVNNDESLVLPQVLNVHNELMKLL